MKNGWVPLSNMELFLQLLTKTQFWQLFTRQSKQVFIVEFLLSPELRCNRIVSRCLGALWLLYLCCSLQLFGRWWPGRKSVARQRRTGHPDSFCWCWVNCTQGPQRIGATSKRCFVFKWHADCNELARASAAYKSLQERLGFEIFSPTGKISHAREIKIPVEHTLVNPTVTVSRIRTERGGVQRVGDVFINLPDKSYTYQEQRKLGGNYPVRGTCVGSEYIIAP